MRTLRGIYPSGAEGGSRTLLLAALGWTVVAGAVPVSLGAQGFSQQCGEILPQEAGQARGRWLDWSEDSFAGNEPLPEYRPILKRLRDFAEPFSRAAVLDPPPSVEIRPHRVIWGATPVELGSPFPRATLLIQVFHPSVQEAGEASAAVRVELNSLFPLFYGLGQPIAEDVDGPIFVAPEQVGTVAGAPVFSSGRPRDCIIVFSAHARPLWTPVSQGRYLQALVASLRNDMTMGDSVLASGKGEGWGEYPAGELQEAIRQLRALDPKAAAEMERMAAEIREEMEGRRATQEMDAGAEAEETVSGFPVQLGRIEAELESMNADDRQAPAYVAGLGGSEVSLLSSPGAPGSRALVAANSDYFDARTSQGRPQLIVVEMASAAAHAPEQTIIARLWQDVDWSRFWQWVREPAAREDESRD